MNSAACEGASKNRTGAAERLEAACSRARAAHRGAPRMRSDTLSRRERKGIGFSFSKGRIGSGPAERERVRSARRMKNLQKIVRKALADYHRIDLERQRRPGK